MQIKMYAHPKRHLPDNRQEQTDNMQVKHAHSHSLSITMVMARAAHAAIDSDE